MAPRSQVKHCTTESLCSLIQFYVEKAHVLYDNAMLTWVQNLSRSNPSMIAGNLISAIFLSFCNSSLHYWPSEISRWPFQVDSH